MADETPKAKVDKAAVQAAARPTQSNPSADPPAPEEVRYDEEALREQRHLLGDGIDSRAIAGAYALASKKRLTLDEAKQAVNEFLGREEPKDYADPADQPADDEDGS